MGFSSRPRLDRAITLALVHPVIRLLKANSGAEIPILMYHGIRDPRGEKHPYFETNTSPQVFEAQMRFLCELGYTATDLGGALASLDLSNECRKDVVITFDDGYRDFFTGAFPILAKYKLSATLFVVSDLTNEQRRSNGVSEYMTWNEIREVYSCGIRIGSHTASHPQLHTRSPEQIDRELRESKESIEDKLGASITSFSYPNAFPEHDKNFALLMKDKLYRYGYQNGVSTIIGTATPRHEPFFLPRLPVNSYDDLRFFQAKLEGSYDWLHTPQRMYKSLFKGNAAGSKFECAVS